MMFLVSGSSAAGKTFALKELHNRQPELAIHDFDEIGVPEKADSGWRHRANETWLQRALEYQAHRVDLLLAGQTPFGELLASPSVTQLEALSACLVDCDDETRLARLPSRGSEWLDSVSRDLQDYINWAKWMRHHAQDPTWQPEVTQRRDSDVTMHWERWATWRRGDPR
jgi:hypothetical protein